MEWPTDLAVNPMDNSLYVLDNNIVLQISENRRVRIIAGRPIHCQVPGIDHFLVSKVAIHSTLESARAISVSHSGLLFIAINEQGSLLFSSSKGPWLNHLFLLLKLQNMGREVHIVRIQVSKDVETPAML